MGFVMQNKLNFGLCNVSCDPDRRKESVNRWNIREFLLPFRFTLRDGK
jgi:hypothetical protein